jgi:hypothetical protein
VRRQAVLPIGTTAIPPQVPARLEDCPVTLVPRVPKVKISIGPTCFSGIANPVEVVLVNVRFAPLPLGVKLFIVIEYAWKDFAHFVIGRAMAYQPARLGVACGLRLAPAA